MYSHILNERIHMWLTNFLDCKKWCKSFIQSFCKSEILSVKHMYLVNKCWFYVMKCYVIDVFTLIVGSIGCMGCHCKCRKTTVNRVLMYKGHNFKFKKRTFYAPHSILRFSDKTVIVVKGALNFEDTINYFFS